MKTFVVMESDIGEPGVRTEFVRDGFAIMALVVPVLWLAWHRLWIEALLALAAAIAIAAFGTISGFGTAAPLLSTLVSIYVAIEGPQLRIAALERRGFSQAATVEASNASDAELRYFSQFEERKQTSQVVTPLVPNKPAGPAEPFAPPGPALGLLDYPGTR